MSHHKTQSDDAIYHFAASGFAAVVNFPLVSSMELLNQNIEFTLCFLHLNSQWRASAIAQSGFKLEGSNILIKYYRAVIQPPFRGLAATMFGMTWARAAIFYGADVGKELMLKNGSGNALAQTVPAFVLGTFVQIANMPLVRATITIQDPKCE